jgi:motility quorum-sensing regulator/GCU-specific mRNA interferase toxin
MTGAARQSGKQRKRRRNEKRGDEDESQPLDATPLWGHLIVMEKRRPTYDLEAIKLAIGSIDTLAITTSAFRTATCSGFDRGAIVEVIQSIERPMFFKSMTTFVDHRVWQDVYRVPARDMELYVKSRRTRSRISS